MRVNPRLQRLPICLCATIKITKNFNGYVLITHFHIVSIPASCKVCYKIRSIVIKHQYIHRHTILDGASKPRAEANIYVRQCHKSDVTNDFKRGIREFPVLLNGAKKHDILFFIILFKTISITNHIVFTNCILFNNI